MPHLYVATRVKTRIYALWLPQCTSMCKYIHEQCPYLNLKAFNLNMGPKA